MLLFSMWCSPCHAQFSFVTSKYLLFHFHIVVVIVAVLVIVVVVIVIVVFVAVVVNNFGACGRLPRIIYLCICFELPTAAKREQESPHKSQAPPLSHTHTFTVPSPKTARHTHAHTHPFRVRAVIALRARPENSKKQLLGIYFHVPIMRARFEWVAMGCGYVIFWMMLYEIIELLGTCLYHMHNIKLPRWQNDTAQVKIDAENIYFVGTTFQKILNIFENFSKYCIVLLFSWTWVVNWI